MNKTITFFLFLLSIGSVTVYCQSNKTNEIFKNKDFSNAEVPFKIDVQIEKVEGDLYDLSVAVELDEGSYIISPFSEDKVYGHFDISIVDNNKLSSLDPLVELPRSVEEFDPIIEAPVRFVRTNTTYKKRLKVGTKNDFEVAGLIWFVYEPSCIPYDINFQISSEDEKVTVKKTSTVISKEYKE